MPSTNSQSVFFLVVALFAVFLSYARPDLTYITPQYSLLQKSEYDADVLVLGGSHAGLSGALTLTRHQHNIIVFDDGKPRNRWDTLMHVLPTWDHQSPNALRKASRAELRRTGLVSIVDERIVKIEKEHDALFRVTSASGREWSGRKLLLATGVEFAFPDIPGYTENFPEKMYVESSGLFRRHY
jgi:thioredoxin reductase